MTHAIAKTTVSDQQYSASLAVAAGPNVKAVQQMLGHALGGHDPRRLRGSLCGTISTVLRTGSTAPTRDSLRTKCGLQGAEAQSRRAAIREFVRTGCWLGHTALEPPRGIEPRTYALRVAGAVSMVMGPAHDQSTDVCMRPRVGCV